MGHRAKGSSSQLRRLIASATVLTCWWAVVLYGRSDAALPMPTSTESACKLHYGRFHLLWTLPLLCILYLLARPFLTRLDQHKLSLLPLIAFVWTTPWDNELVRQGAWWYPRSCVVARIGYVPVEEYAFFIVQSWITTLLSICLTRWSTPNMLSIRCSRFVSILLPSVPVLTATLGFVGLSSDKGFGTRYYISMIAWWASIPLILLWFGTRRSWIGMFGSGRALPWLTSLALPTLYLCCADVFALRRGTWHIDERKSLNRFVVRGLPIEEAIFFAVTNLILVSACFAFDRVVWQLRTKEISTEKTRISPLSPTLFTLNKRTVPKIWTTFLQLDDPNDNEEGKLLATQDFALNILRRASKSFHVASFLLPWDLRTDLGSLYAFARAMDDFIDTPVKGMEHDNLSERIKILQQLVRASFGNTSDNSTHESVAQRIRTCMTSSSHLHAAQRNKLILSAQAASILRDIVPMHLWLELIDGYTTDSQPGGPRFDDFQAQAKYAQDVAGSIGEMCVRVIFARCGIDVDREVRTTREVQQDQLTRTSASCQTTGSLDIHQILQDARRMGVSLQLINIARDVVSDANKLQRCYLVLNKNNKQDYALRESLSTGYRSSPHDTEKQKQILFTHKMRLVELAETIFHASKQSIERIPDGPARTGFNVACAVYMAIGDAIRRDGVEGCARRSHLTAWERIVVAVKAAYFGLS